MQTIQPPSPLPSTSCDTKTQHAAGMVVMARGDSVRDLVPVTATDVPEVVIAAMIPPLPVISTCCGN